ncbi:MAG: hypothetical protein K8F58_02600 [Bauldia sp.]|nr:hypothetical protein [Bauldia sp.]
MAKAILPSSLFRRDEGRQFLRHDLPEAEIALWGRPSPVMIARLAQIFSSVLTATGPNRLSRFHSLILTGSVFSPATCALNWMSARLEKNLHVEGQGESVLRRRHGLRWRAPGDDARFLVGFAGFLAENQWARG